MSLCLQALLRHPRSARRGRRLHHGARDQPDVRRADRPVDAGGLARHGPPRPLRLVELGPGRGTLMADLLRAARLLPDFLAAATVHLVETSPALRRAAAGRPRRVRLRPSTGTTGSRTCRPARRSSSPTSSSMPCRSASSSRPSAAGASGWSGLDGDRPDLRPAPGAGDRLSATRCGRATSSNGRAASIDVMRRARRAGWRGTAARR